MTSEFEKSFELANILTLAANQKRSLFEEFEQAVLYFYNGGTFKIDQQLISFLNALTSYNSSNTCVLIDSNNLPIEIEDIKSFLEKIIDQYVQASNAYLAGYQKIKNNRSSSSILDL